MKIVRIVPAVISFLLIAAHFYRAGLVVLAFSAVIAPVLLWVARPWSGWIVRFLLVLSALEWGRTLLQLVQIRIEMGLDWTRLAIILGAVILFTLMSALLIQPHRK